MYIGDSRIYGIYSTQTTLFRKSCSEKLVVVFFCVLSFSSLSLSFDTLEACWCFFFFVSYNTPTSYSSCDMISYSSSCLQVLLKSVLLFVTRSVEYITQTGRNTFTIGVGVIIGKNGPVRECGGGYGAFYVPRVK